MALAASPSSLSTPHFFGGADLIIWSGDLYSFRTLPRTKKKPKASFIAMPSSSPSENKTTIVRGSSSSEREKEREAREKKEEADRKIASRKAISIILRREATKAVIEKKRGPTNSKKLLPRTVLEALHERITALRWESALKVSNTYSKEISGNPAISPHLYKFHGILNGIDPDIWDPYNDNFIPNVSWKKVPALSFGPAENTHVTKHKMVMKRFPVSIRKQQWSKIDKEKLVKGAKQQYREMQLLNSVNIESVLDGSINSKLMPVAVNCDLEFTPEKIRSFLPLVNWGRLASLYLPGRHGTQCESRLLEGCLRSLEIVTRNGFIGSIRDR